VDYFESIVKTLLEAEGYWVRQSFRVELTKAEKVRIGKQSIPRPEIDLLAFMPSKNLVLVLEVKSYLDSPGVRLKDIQVEGDFFEGRYKLLTSATYRRLLLARLKKQMVELGMINKETKFQIGLAAGKIYQGNEQAVQHFLRRKGWFFWSPSRIKEKVENLAETSYMNDPVTIAAKILLRGTKSTALGAPS
jgi:hypothetical protein